MYTSMVSLKSTPSGTQSSWLESSVDARLQSESSEHLGAPAEAASPAASELFIAATSASTSARGEGAKYLEGFMMLVTFRFRLASWCRGRYFRRMTDLGFLSLPPSIVDGQEERLGAVLGWRGPEGMVVEDAVKGVLRQEPVEMEASPSEQEPVPSRSGFAPPLPCKQLESSSLAAQTERQDSSKDGPLSGVGDRVRPSHTWDVSAMKRL